LTAFRSTRSKLDQQGAAMSTNHLHRTTTSTPERIEVRIALRVNNTSHEYSRLTLLDTLRDVLDLTGRAESCLVDGRPR
jgi:hypothetical protein